MKEIFSCPSNKLYVYLLSKFDFIFYLFYITNFFLKGYKKSIVIIFFQLNYMAFGLLYILHLIMEFLALL